MIGLFDRYIKKMNNSISNNVYHPSEVGMHFELRNGFPTHGAPNEALYDLQHPPKDAHLSIYGLIIFLIIAILFVLIVIVARDSLP